MKLHFAVYQNIALVCSVIWCKWLLDWNFCHKHFDSMFEGEQGDCGSEWFPVHPRGILYDKEV